MFLPDPSGHRDVALALARDAGRVLLVRNARSAQGLSVAFWDLPGGTVEPGEPLADALAREVAEETGLLVASASLALVVDGCKRHAPGGPPLYTWRAFVFDVVLAPGRPPTAGPEIDAVAWVDEAEACARMQGPYQAPVVRWLRGDRSAWARCDWVEPEPATRGPLSARERHLCVVAAAAAAGDAALVAAQVALARGEGVAAEALEEALLQVVPYAGFPRALGAFATARPALGALPPPGGERPAAARPEAGDAAFRAVYGDTAERVRGGLAGLHPLLPAWTTEFAYGRVLARDGLDLRTRELLAVSILTAMGGADDALLGHMRAAVRLGASREAVAGAVAVVPPSCGVGKRAAARALLPRLR